MLLDISAYTSQVTAHGMLLLSLLLAERCPLFCVWTSEARTQHPLAGRFAKGSHHQTIFNVAVNSYRGLASQIPSDWLETRGAYVQAWQCGIARGEQRTGMQASCNHQSVYKLDQTVKRADSQTPQPRPRAMRVVDLPVRPQPVKICQCHCWYVENVSGDDAPTAGWLDHDHDRTEHRNIYPVGSPIAAAAQSMRCCSHASTPTSLASQGRLRSIYPLPRALC
jgi:hypothetical protein